MFARATHTWREGYKGKRVRQAVQLRLPSCCCGDGMGDAGKGGREGGQALHRGLLAAPVSSGVHV